MISLMVRGGRLLLPTLMSCFSLPGCSNGCPPVLLYMRSPLLTNYEPTSTPGRRGKTYFQKRRILQLCISYMATRTPLILVSKAPAACGEIYFQKRVKNQPDVHFLQGDRRCLWSSSRRTRPRLARLHSPAYLLQSCWSNLQFLKSVISRDWR